RSSQKRSRAGRRFGFFRFLEVGIAEWIAQKLNRIWIGSYRLSVNVAKFAKKSAAKYKAISLPKPFSSNSDAPRLRGVTYADTVRSSPRLNPYPDLEHGKRKQEQIRQCVEVSSVESEFSWLRGSFTGVLKSINTLRDLGNRMKEA
ncbi:hypothetical protein Ancab_014482, partial [Ancistrocladus abbreviatus]